jgi:pimeloyl-ACP methyl ester carboxylesterase
MMKLHGRCLAILAVTLLVPEILWGQTPSSDCGEVVTIATHDSTTTRYTYAPPPAAVARRERIALVLLPGGGGHVDLDRRGCPRKLRGNSLIRSISEFHDAGFATALVDAPSDHHGEDGLATFRIASEHAQDLGKVIADLRARDRGAVWVVGTSRGTLSAMNAASRLTGAASPDGVVITSPVMVGAPQARKAFAMQSVFDLPIGAVRVPILVVGHALDACIRTPATQIPRLMSRLQSPRMQSTIVQGGPGAPAAPNVDACEGRSPHGFIEQESFVAAGIARFIRGGLF